MSDHQFQIGASITQWRGESDTQDFVKMLDQVPNDASWSEVLNTIAPFSGGALIPGREPVLAMGDLHGCNPEILKRDLHRVGLVDIDGKWLNRRDYKFVQMGDLVDRGSHNLEVYDYMRELKLQAGDNLIRLVGNHDLYHIVGHPESIRALPIPGLQSRFLEDILSGQMVCAWSEYDTIYTHAGIDLKFFPEFKDEPPYEIVSQLNLRFRTSIAKFAVLLIEAKGDQDARDEAESRLLKSDRIFDIKNGIFWTRSNISNDQFRQVVGHTPQRSGIRCRPGDRVKYIDAGRIFGELGSIQSDQAQAIMGNSVTEEGVRWIAAHPETHRTFVSSRNLAAD